MKPRSRWLRRALFALFCLAAAVIVPCLIVEGYFYAAIRHTWILSVSPRFLAAEARIQYWLHDANEIQYQTDSARWDPVLGYILKPGRSTFGNPEFSTEVSVNSAGLRDDEESLREPEVIVAGDSEAMGWGVGQTESFPYLLKGLTGKKVLNTGIASYGTAREMMLARRFFSPRLKFFIIQYSENDYNENLAFEREGDRLKVMDEDRWLGMTSSPAEKAYHPFEYLGFELLKLRFARGYARNMAPPPSRRRVAELFLNAVSALGEPGLSRGVTIIAFEAGMNGEFTGFYEGLSEEIRKGKWPAWIKAIRAADLSGAITPGRCFALDGHMNREGHAAVARALADLMAAGRGPKARP